MKPHTIELAGAATWHGQLDRPVIQAARMQAKGAPRIALTLLESEFMDDGNISHGTMSLARAGAEQLLNALHKFLMETQTPGPEDFTELQGLLKDMYVQATEPPLKPKLSPEMLRLAAELMEYGSAAFNRDDEPLEDDGLALLLALSDEEKVAMLRCDPDRKGCEHLDPELIEEEAEEVSIIMGLVAGYLDAAAGPPPAVEHGTDPEGCGRSGCVVCGPSGVPEES